MLAARYVPTERVIGVLLLYLSVFDGTYTAIL